MPLPARVSALWLPSSLFRASRLSTKPFLKTLRLSPGGAGGSAGRPPCHALLRFPAAAEDTAKTRIRPDGPAATLTVSARLQVACPVWLWSASRRRMLQRITTKEYPTSPGTVQRAVCPAFASRPVFPFKNAGFHLNRSDPTPVEPIPLFYNDVTLAKKGARTQGEK